jgi:hypothetical protein
MNSICKCAIPQLLECAIGKFTPHMPGKIAHSSSGTRIHSSFAAAESAPPSAARMAASRPLIGWPCQVTTPLPSTTNAAGIPETCAGASQVGRSGKHRRCGWDRGIEVGRARGRTEGTRWVVLAERRRDRGGSCSRKAHRIAFHGAAGVDRTGVGERLPCRGLQEVLHLRAPERARVSHLRAKGRALHRHRQGARQSTGAACSFEIPTKSTLSLNWPYSFLRVSREVTAAQHARHLEGQVGTRFSGNWGRC